MKRPYHRRIRRQKQPDLWETLEFEDVTPELVDLVSRHLEGERASGDALSARLTGTITFAGALLALGVGLGHNAAEAQFSGTGRTVFSVCFVVVVALLVASLARCLVAIRPQSRPLPNPALLRYYAERATDAAEIRVDSFKLYGATLESLSARNGALARAVRDGLVLVALALVTAAVAGLTIYFSTPWAKTQRTPTSRPEAKTAQTLIRRPTLALSQTLQSRLSG